MRDRTKGQRWIPAAYQALIACVWSSRLGDGRWSDGQVGESDGHDGQPSLDRRQMQLRSALVADALDEIGLRHQCLGTSVSAIHPRTVVMGRARTIRAIRVDEPPATPYQGLLRALDAVVPGDMITFATAGAADVAIWGELLTRACMARGAVGAVCDGAVRDVALLRELAFPVFARGTIPYDVNGRAEVVEHDCEVTIDGVLIRPRDLVIADDDGVVIVPDEVSENVLARALVKAGSENEFRDALAHGVGALDAYARYGVL